MAKWILDTTELTLAFGDRLLLQTDRLTVFEGDRIGLIGENGAGKTTLLRILAGELPADTGAVRCLVPVAVIHQQGNAEPGEDRQVESLFRAPGLRAGLSGGEMTRNRIAGALAAGARLLMADEPTTDLDEEGQRLPEQANLFAAGGEGFGQRCGIAVDEQAHGGTEVLD